MPPGALSMNKATVLRVCLTFDGRIITRGWFAASKTKIKGASTVKIGRVCHHTNTHKRFFVRLLFHLAICFLVPASSRTTIISLLDRFGCVFLVAFVGILFRVCLLHFSYFGQDRRSTSVGWYVQASFCLCLALFEFIFIYCPP